MSKNRKYVNAIMIKLFDDGSSACGWQGELNLDHARQILQNHANLLSEEIGVRKQKEQEKKIKVVSANAMPKMGNIH